MTHLALLTAVKFHLLVMAKVLNSSELYTIHIPGSVLL